MTAASPEIGGGHVLRCMALAEALQRQSMHPVFAVDRATLDTVPLLADSTFDIVDPSKLGADGHERVQNVETVVFDGYEWDWSIERAWRGRSPCRVVIDDLANRRHDCELLVDHTPGRLAQDYADLVPNHCEMLVGPSHALLRSDFRRLRDLTLPRRSDALPRRLLISMGLTDVAGITRRAAEGALLAGLSLQVDVVVSRRAESLDWLRRAASDDRLRVHVDLESEAMAELMAAADLAIGGGGGTSLERCCLGLPSLVILLADNQRLIADNLQRAGAVRVIGEVNTVTSDQVAAALRSFAGQGALLKDCARAAAMVVDGNGADRVAQAIRRRARHA
jgi:UDP-2,4-diacetamido-2,4,6-trideoxy-beta-L-altropyranose hydrolase